MTTLINRHMFWAVNDAVIPCTVVAHDLETARVTVLLANGTRHDADAYNVRVSQDDAQRRLVEMRGARAMDDYMTGRWGGVI